MKFLRDLINKGNVLGIIEGMMDMYEDNDEEYKVLNCIYTMINNLIPYQIVEAGNINIICDDVCGFDRFLNERKEK